MLIGKRTTKDQERGNQENGIRTKETTGDCRSWKGANTHLKYLAII